MIRQLPTVWGSIRAPDTEKCIPLPSPHELGTAQVFWPLQVRNPSSQLLLEFTGFYPWEDNRGKADSWAGELTCGFPQ